MLEDLRILKTILDNGFELLREGEAEARTKYKKHSLSRNSPTESLLALMALAWDLVGF